MVPQSTQRTSVVLGEVVLGEVFFFAGFDVFFSCFVKVWSCLVV